MDEPRFDDLTVGDELPELRLPPVSRTTLALYAGASGDHNPIHIDLDFARQADLPDVFAHGMLSAAYVGRLLTRWVRPERIRRLALRFTSITQLRDAPLCTGRVVEKLQQDGEWRVRLELKCSVRDGTQTVLAEALVALR